MAGYSTEQKRLIEAFLDAHAEDSYTIEQLIGAIRSEYPSEAPPAKSTVYRLMQRLVVSGRVRRFSISPSRRFLYQSVCSGRDHLHLLCAACNKLVHVDADTSKKVLRLLNADRYVVDGGRTVLAGTCGDCRRSGGGEQQ